MCVARGVVELSLFMCAAHKTRNVPKMPRHNVWLGIYAVY